MNKTTDNFFKDFPARMSDGRFITDYTPNCQLNLEFQQNMTSWQYRSFLTKMGNELRKQEMLENEQLYGCDICHQDSGVGHRYEQLCNENGCTIKEVNPNGIGIKQSN